MSLPGKLSIYITFSDTGEGNTQYCAKATLWQTAPPTGQGHGKRRVSLLILVTPWQYMTPPSLSWWNWEVTSSANDLSCFLICITHYFPPHTNSVCQQPIPVIERSGDLLLETNLCSSWDIQVKVLFTKARPWVTLPPGLDTHLMAWRICDWLQYLGNHLNFDFNIGQRL